jgi:hypothetical protein
MHKNTHKQQQNNNIQHQQNTQKTPAYTAKNNRLQRRAHPHQQKHSNHPQNKITVAD